MNVFRLPWALGVVVMLTQVALGLILFAVFQEYVPHHLGAGSGWPGYLLAAYGVGRFMFEGIAGAVSDLIERRRGLVAGLTLMVPSIVLMAAVQYHEPYLAFALFLGLGTAFFWPSIYSIIADLYPSHDRGRIVGFLNLAQIAGFGIGALAGAFLVDPAPGVLFLVAITSVSFAGIVVLLAVPGYVSPAAEAGHESRRPSVRSAFSGPIAALAAIILITSIATAVIVPAIRPFGSDVLHISFARLTVALIPAVITGLVLYVPAGHASDRIGRIPVFLFGLALLIGGLITLAQTDSLPVASAAAAVTFAGNVLVVPAWSALIMDLAPPAYRGTIIGLSVALNGLGLAAGSALGGAVVQAGGAPSAFRTSAAITLAAAVSLVLFRLRFGHSTAPIQPVPEEEPR